MGHLCKRLTPLYKQIVRIILRYKRTNGVDLKGTDVGDSLKSTFTCR